MKKLLYLTTPIFYPNDRLHLGHAYNMVLADIIVRYKKSQGYSVYFQTGSDDHGEKIEKKAASLNLTPQQLVDKNVLLFQQLWKELGISKHNFYRTSAIPHKEKTQKIFTELLNKGDIYLGEYQGKYCVSCEDYISDSKVLANNLCPTPDCQAELRKVDEPAYFLKISKYRSQLIEYYRKNPSFLLPTSAKKELFSNFLNQEKIPDLCITRSDIKWGIPVPNHQKMVIYVWFEALLNYLNSEAGERFFVTEFPEKKVDNAVEFSLVVIQNPNQEYLLVHNKKRNRWEFPGGKLEKGETPEAAACREILEETNLVIDIDNLVKIGEKTFYEGNSWWKGYFYQTSQYSGELYSKERETIGEIKFLKVNEMLAINSQLSDFDKVSNKYLLEKLTNQNSAAGVVHLIGKEIVRFHAIYWPIILFSLNKQLPNKILAHGWLVDSKGKKESKSKGNIKDPVELLKKYPRDLLRAYLVAKINFLQDGVCSEDFLKEFYQEFLVNNLSNLISRVNKMLHLYNQGIIPEYKENNQNEKLKNYHHQCRLAVQEFQKKMNEYKLTEAFWQVEKLVKESNKLIADLVLWELAKQNETLLLHSTLNYVTNGIKIIAFLLSPIIPETSQNILEAFNIEKTQLNWNNVLDFNFLNRQVTKPLSKHLYSNLT